MFIYSFTCSCVLVVLVCCQYLPSDWLERLLRTPICGKAIVATKPMLKRTFVCILFILFVCYYVFPYSPAQCGRGTV